MLNNSFFSKKHLKRFISFILVCSFVFAGFVPAKIDKGLQTVYAAQKLKLSAAKSIAVSRSSKIESLELQIEAKKAAKESSIKSLEEKERNMSTFRWSPLLSFKFPTTPNEAEAFEFRFKPIQLDYNIKTLQHKMNDEKLAEYETVSNLYIDIITYTTEISFLEERINNLSVTILKNKARVLEGTATQKQVDNQQKKLDKMKKDLATQQKKLLQSKEKLGKRLGFSITKGYDFDEAFIATNMNRDTVQSLQVIAVDNDQTVFEARQEMDLASLNLSINYNLMTQKYGGNIDMIKGYITQISNGTGGDVNKRAFKKDYDAFLKKIDAPWNGSWRILFFKIPKEWLKGSNDGVRYVEDDPYVLYTAALDYQAARKEYNNACDELRQNVADGYDALMDARDTYRAAQNSIRQQKVDLLAAETKNALGTLSFDEYETMNDEYEAARTELKDALSSYSKSLYSFDKTTCGGASAYFLAESLSAQAGSAGLGTPEDIGQDPLAGMDPVIAHGATYSIRSIVDTQEFVLYVDVPEDFDYNITHFELWADNRQIGERVPVSGSIRHLKLSVSDTNSIFVRLYNGSEFIDDCAIDPDASYGPLNITTGYDTEALINYPVIGNYTIEDDTTTDMIKVRFEFDQQVVKEVYPLGADVAFYNMAAEKSLYLFSNELVEQDKAFTYMAFIKRDIPKLTLRLFDKNGNYIGGAKFDASNGNIFVDKSVTNEDMQKMAARQIITEIKGKELTDELKRVTDLYNAAKIGAEGEADTATVEYYKKRIDEINDEIKIISAGVTDEEIERALLQYKSEIDTRVSEMRTGDEAADESGLSADEVDARNKILREAAINYIKAERNDKRKEAINKSITDYENELMKLQREYKATTNKNKKKELEQQIKDIQAKIKLEKDKLNLVDNREVTEEEINKAILEHGDEIYSAVVDKLSNAMLFGSPTGQWAVQYLQSHGYPETEENVRIVVAAAGDYDNYEQKLERKASLEEELRSAKEKYTKLIKQGSPADKACAKQVEKIIESYKKEIKILIQEIEAVDPGRGLK